MLNIVGLIPARFNSKRVPKKNIRILGDKPLIAWTINLAKEVEALSDVYVSTDSQEISDLAIEYGAKSPWIRSSDLAHDNALTIDVVIDFIHKLEEIDQLPDGILLLQPTSPFRSKKSIQDAIKIFEKDLSKSVVSFSRASINPEWCFRLNNEKIIPITSWQETKKRSQDIDDTFQLNGLIYLASPDFIVSNKSFLNSFTKPLIIDSGFENLDIDTENDFLYAEEIAKKI